MARNEAVRRALSEREGREITADEIEGRIVAEILRNSDLTAYQSSGGIHDYNLRAVVGCQNLNCNGYQTDVHYRDADYNRQYITPNSNSYARGISYGNTGVTYNQLVTGNVQNNPVSTGIAGVGMVGLGVAIAGPAAVGPRLIASGTGMTANAGFQSFGDQPLDWWDIGIAGVTGFLTGGASSWTQGLSAATLINSGGALTASVIRGESPNAGMGGAVFGTAIGYPIGKAFEVPLNRIYNAWFRSDWIPAGPYGVVQQNVPSVIPGATGGAFSSGAQEWSGSPTKDSINRRQGK